VELTVLVVVVVELPVEVVVEEMVEATVGKGAVLVVEEVEWPL
jgi:hypothetical protein